VARKIDNYQFLVNHGHVWLANCLFTGKHAAKRLQIVRDLLEDGWEVDVPEFEMPDKGLTLNGTFFKWESIN
jgi:hypothetical protein